jgi:hypothetical protein
MQKIEATLNLRAGDLVGHLNCRYLTELDLKVAYGELEKPKDLGSGAGVTRCTDRYRRQVSRSGGADRHLFDVEF